MTDYPTKRGGWRARQVQRKWRDILAVFISALLILAIFNGFWKGLSLKRFLGTSTWDSRTPLAVVLWAEPISLVIYQPEPERLAFLKLNEESFLPSGKAKESLVKLSEIAVIHQGSQLTKSFSLAFRANIRKYVFLKEKQRLDQEGARDLFKKFASLATPFLLVWGKYENTIEETNIARWDLFKLWWRLKSLSFEKLELVDLSSLSEEVIGADGKTILGLDDAALHLAISQYLENPEFAHQDQRISVANASGITGAGQLAADFIGAIGGRVESLTTTASISQTTLVLTSDKDSAQARYLANLFECDINSLPASPSRRRDEQRGEPKEAGDQLKVVIGGDFAKKYFQ